MEDISYNLSMYDTESELETVTALPDNNGWTVYVIADGEKKELESTGFATFSGLDYPGQTFYYSRKLTESLDNPTLNICAVNRTTAVFLDDSLIYTDFPDLDNRIGYLELPMLDYDRTEPVTVSLPPDYKEKTLTIAQSTPVQSEKEFDSSDVFPMEITLYCGYSYESELISEASRTMIPAVLLFALLLFLLGLFLWNVSLGQFLSGLPVLALALLLQMSHILFRANFADKYLDEFPIDLQQLFFDLSIGILFAFLAVQAKGYRFLPVTCALIQTGSSLAYDISTQANLLDPSGNLHAFFMFLPAYSGFFCALAILGLSIVFLRRRIRFFRYMSRAALTLIGGYLLFLAACAVCSKDYVLHVFSSLTDDAAILVPSFSLRLLWILLLLSTLYAAILELIEREAERRTENNILSTKVDLALKSYENLHRQSEEIQMIRHDTMRHYRMLRQAAEKSPESLIGYLDELIGQTENIQPIVTTGNQLLDIILNGELNTAIQQGIKVEVTRSQAPANLPITDAEACCLFTNILDNAIAAASASPEPCLKLDIHRRDQHFVFSSENSMGKTGREKEKPIPGHGYGLKIIQKIMKQWGDMVYIETSENKYKLTIVMPLT